MAKLKDDEIRWILSLDAKGVQSELTSISSVTKQLTEENKKLEAKLKAAEKKMSDAEKEMKKLAAAGKEDSEAFRDAQANYKFYVTSVADYTKKIRDNTKAIQENKAKAEEMVKTLKIEDMTMNQLKQRAYDLQKQLDNTSKSTHPEVYKALEKELKQVNGRMGELKNSSKEAERGMKGALQVFAGNMMTKALQFLASALKDAINTLRTFEKANSVLASILGKTRKEIKDLTSSAMELGRTSVYTASQVTKLQTELAKLGFSVQEIKNSQKDILNFATALNAELPDAASLAGASLRAFGADTKETQRYVSAMTVAAHKSALSFEYMATAMPIVAPVAKAFNFTIEDTLALLGKLANSGFNATSGATALRNIFLNLADTNGKLAKSIGGPVHNLEELIAGFKKLKAQGIDLATALELTDKRSVAAFQTFLQGADDLVTLRDSLQGVGDELQKIADEQMNNLDGSIKKLSSAWENLMLQFSNSTGPMKTVVDWITRIVEGWAMLLDQFNKLQDRAAYQPFLDKKREEAKDKMYIELRPGSGYKDMSKLNADEKQKYFEDISSEYGIQKELLNKEISEIEKQKKDLKEKYDKIVAEDKETLNLFGKIISPFYTSTPVSEAEKELEQISIKADIAKTNLEALNDTYKEILGGYNPYANDTKQKPAAPSGDTKKQDKELERQKEEYDLLVESLETKHLERLSEIKKKYASGVIKTESEYNQLLFSENQAYNIIEEQALTSHLEKLKNSKVKNADLESEINKRLATLRTKRLDDEIKFQAKIEKILLEADPIAKEEKEYKERITAAGLFGIDREKLTAEQLKALELLEQQHQDNLLKIRNDARAKEKARGEEQFQENFGKDKAGKKKEIEDEANTLSLQKEIGALTPTEAFDAEVELQKKRLTLIREELDARKAAGLDLSNILKNQASEEAVLTKLYTGELNRRKQEYQQYGTAIGTVLGNVISGQEDALKGFADVMLDILFDTLTQIINAEIIKVVASGTGAIARSTAEAMAAPDSVLSFGATGFARIAILTGVITAAMAVAKSTLKGLISGGGKSSSTEAKTGQRVDNTGLADGGFNYGDPGTDGGYTGPGGRYQVKGTFPNGVTYHAGEYVVAQPEMKIPAVSKMIHAIEGIRRQRTNSNPMPAGLADGGYNSDTDVPVPDSVGYRAQDVAAVVEVLDRVGKILDRVEENGLGVNYYSFEDAKKTVDRSRNGASKY
ncbi:MAG: phage tail tape measure protein [Prevotella sp.]|jgi:TP901 family phage tail tape measure protein|nr:phage tail tape measure protein [Prevotella sp.]